MNRLPPWWQLAIGGYWAALLVVLLAFLYDLWHLSRSETMLYVALGSVSAVFGVVATWAASRAWQEASNVAEVLGSFRMSFRDVLEEMTLIVRGATTTLAMLLPTPGYGFLFRQPVASKDLIAALESFLEKEGSHLDLLLVFGDRHEPRRQLLPNVYLRRSHALRQNEGYVQLVKQFFALVRRYPEKIELCLLRTDPNVRIVIADSNLPEGRVCLLSVAQSKPAERERDFDSKGFTSRRSEMVEALDDLMEVYRSELGVDKRGLGTLEHYYTVL